MEHCDIVVGLLVPANEDATEAVHPTMGALHHPAPGFEPRAALDRLRLLAPRSDVGGEAELHDEVADLVVVIALVQAQALSLRARGPRAFGVGGDALQR